MRRYAETLKKKKYPFSAVYMFGSHANGTASPWSDIDVAVVSKKMMRQYDRNRVRLWDLRLDVDTRIEPHGFTPKDFADDANPMAHEIRRTGIRIA